MREISFVACIQYVLQVQVVCRRCHLCTSALNYLGGGEVPFDELQAMENLTKNVRWGRKFEADRPHMCGRCIFIFVFFRRGV